MLIDMLRRTIADAIAAAQEANALPMFAIPQAPIEPPPRPEQGDFATPVALQLAKLAGRSPRVIAEAIVAHLPPNGVIAEAAIAGAGFINLRLRPEWLAQQVDVILARGEHFADSTLGNGRMAQVEFISANPTGPLTVGHGRNAVLGDTMARVLAAAGWHVTREYYFNDGGLQMKNLAESVRLRAQQELGEAVVFPEGYYQGEYIRAIARDIVASEGPDAALRDWTYLRDRAVSIIFADIRRTQERLGIRFDIYTNELTFFDTARPGNVWDVVERLRDAGVTYEADEATWFRAKQFGADKDRVLLRSATASIFGALRAAQARHGIPIESYTHEGRAEFYDPTQSGNVWQALADLRAQGVAYEENGRTLLRATRYGAAEDVELWGLASRPDPTYRLPDIAYHVDKLARGFELVVDVLGVDHIAQFPDIRAALAALGYDAARIRVLSYQFVTLVRRGEVVKMSTRRAEYVTLDELIDEVGADAVRFFMLMRSSDAPIEFDLDLAKRQSDENPVYYVQYAHARTAGILERAAPERGVALDLAADVRGLTHPSELALIKGILRLSEIVVLCATSLDLHHLTFYARDLAAAFHAFYRDCPVLAAPEPSLVAARLKLVQATRIALARTLALMGMSAPTHM